MVRTPARSAALMPPAPCACAATKRPQRSGLFDGHGELGVRVLLGARRNALRHHRAGRENLHEVRAVLEVGSHRLPHLVHAVGEVADDRDVDVDGELSRVAGAAGGGNVVAGHLQTRTRHRPLVDGVAQIDVHVWPGRPHVAARRESRHERGPRIDGAVNCRAARRRREERRLPIGPDFVGEVRVKVDETGEHCGGAQVDDLVGCHSFGRADSFNLVAANEHCAVYNWRPAAAVDDLRRTNQHGARRRRLTGAGAKGGRGDETRCSEQQPLRFSPLRGVSGHVAATLP